MLKLFPLLLVFFLFSCTLSPRQKVAVLDRGAITAFSDINTKHDQGKISDAELVRLNVLVQAAEHARKRVRSEWLQIEHGGGNLDLFNVSLDLLEAALAALAEEQKHGTNPGPTTRDSGSTAPVTGPGTD